MEARGTESAHVALVAAIIFILLFSAVGLGAGSTAVQNAPLRKAKLVTMAGHGVNVVPVDVALGLDLFRKHGVDVEVVYVKSGSEAGTTLLSGSVDFAVMSIDHVIKAAVQGKQLVMIGLVNQYPGCVLAVRKGLQSEVSSPKDLEGRTVGVLGTGSTSHMILNQLVRKSGGNPDLLKPVSLGLSALQPALEEAQVDAAIAWEPVTSMLLKRDSAFVLVDLGTPEACRSLFGGQYAQAGLMTTPEYVKANPETAKSVATAISEALGWMSQHEPEDIVGLLPQEAVPDKDLYVRALQSQRFIFPATSWMEPSAIANVVAFFRDNGIIAPDTNISPEALYMNLEDVPPIAAASQPATASDNRALMLIVVAAAIVLVGIALVGARRRSRR